MVAWDTGEWVQYGSDGPVKIDDYWAAQVADTGFHPCTLIIPPQVRWILRLFSRRFYEARLGCRARCVPDRIDLGARFGLSRVVGAASIGPW